MKTVLEFLGLAFYICLVIGLAAGVTWLVVRISPTKQKSDAKQSG